MNISALFPASIEQHTRIQRLDDCTYAAELSKLFCVGIVPNGGYVSSIFLRAAKDYMTPYGQPDAVAVHWQFLTKTCTGRAVLRIEEARRSRNMSILHVALFQDKLLQQSPWIASSSKPCVVAYITCRDMNLESGLSLPTNWKLSHPPPPADFSASQSSPGDKWSRYLSPMMKQVPAMINLEFYSPIGVDPIHPHQRIDLWFRLAQPGARFSDTDIPYLVDAAAPLIVESYRPGKNDSTAPYFPSRRAFWYPTISMSLDVKKKVPAGGAEWLRLHTSAKVIRNGRLDSEVVIFDTLGDVVALSHHVAMIVDVERMFADGGKAQAQGKSKSKI